MFPVRSRRLLPAVCAAAFAGVTLSAPASAGDDRFVAWTAALRAEAMVKGVSGEGFDRAMDGVEPLPAVIESFGRQPEVTFTTAQYLERAVSAKRIATGRAMLAENAPLFAAMEQRFGIAPAVLAAFWGMESNYGQVMGSYYVVAALATLAYDAPSPKRRSYSRTELIAALRILEDGHVDRARMVGSWAGAMGQTQFMPTVFRSLAVDGDGDGRKDLWDSRADALASTANYIVRHGWKPGLRWGMAATLRAGASLPETGLGGPALSLADWRARGVTPAGGGDAAAGLAPELRLILPDGRDGPAFLVGPGYRAFYAYNPSHRYALAIGLLADQLETP